MRLKNVILLTIFLAASFTARVRADEISDVRQAILDNNAKWTAGETSVSNLSQEERKRLCGGIPPDAQQPLQADNESTLAKGTLPRQFDWRNNGGVNFVSDVRRQMTCGSCFVFAPVAALESQVIRASLYGRDIDLSEQIVLSCSGAGSCAAGGNASKTSDFLKTTGTSLEVFYPYTDSDGTCGNAQTGWHKKAYRFTGWSYANAGQLMTSPETLKAAIYAKGPVVVWMDAWSDLLQYKSGVYTHVSGEDMGGHYVLAVGWDDDNAAFIVKNSWGPDWGEAGYFRIMYSELSSPKVRFGEWAIQYDGVAIVKDAGSLPAVFLLHEERKNCRIY